MIEKLKYAKYYTRILFRNWTDKKESYAQHGEDLLVEQLLGQIESFIDIGANDGVLFSNTFKFAKKGARGLCVEPSRKSFRKLKLNHLFHRKVSCIHSAVSSQSGYLYLKEEDTSRLCLKSIAMLRPILPRYGRLRLINWSGDILVLIK